MEKRNLFKDFGKFIKAKWKFFLLSNLLVLVASILAVIFEPIMRGINKAAGIVCLICFAFMAVFSIIYIWVETKRIDKEEIDLDYKFLYYYSTIIISGVLITIFAVVLRAINSNSQILIEGFAGIISLVIYYLAIGLSFFSGTLLIEDK